MVHRLGVFFSLTDEAEAVSYVGYVFRLPVWSPTGPRGPVMTHRTWARIFFFFFFLCCIFCSFKLFSDAGLQTELCLLCLSACY